MFGNFEVMSRCDSAIFTAQRRPMRRLTAASGQSGSDTTVGLPESAWLRIA